MKNILLIIILFCCNWNLSAQTFDYNKAQELYAQGNYLAALEKLEFKSSEVSSSEKENALILKAKICLELKDENHQNVENIMEAILKNNPNFKLSEDIYNEDFKNTFKKFDVQPRFYGGASIGLNIPFFKVTKVNSVLDSTNYDAKYSAKQSYLYTGFMEWRFMKDISVNAAYSYSKMMYNRSLISTSSNHLKLNYNEIVYANEFSLNLRKYFQIKQFKPYFGLGVNYARLRQALGSVELKYIPNDRYTAADKEKNVAQNNIEITNLRSSSRFGILTAIGVSKKVKNILFFFDVNYLHEWKQFNTLNATNGTLLYQYYYIDNDIKLRRFDFRLSVAYILHYSIKKKLK